MILFVDMPTDLLVPIYPVSELFIEEQDAWTSECLLAAPLARIEGTQGAPPRPEELTEPSTMASFPARYPSIGTEDESKIGRSRGTDTVPEDGVSVPVLKLVEYCSVSPGLEPGSSSCSSRCRFAFQSRRQIGSP